MEIIEDKILGRFENIKDDVYSKFGSLWLNEKHFDNHIHKRLAIGHIDNRDDYISKTLECLSNSSAFVFAQHDKSWDNICYNKSKDWAVIFNEAGQIMTSYKVEPESKSFESSQISIKAKIKKGVPNEKFRQYFKQLRK